MLLVSRIVHYIIKETLDIVNKEFGEKTIELCNTPERSH